MTGRRDTTGYDLRCTMANTRDSISSSRADPQATAFPEDHSKTTNRRSDFCNLGLEAAEAFKGARLQSPAID